MIPSLSNLKTPRPQAVELADRLSLIPRNSVPIGEPYQKERNWSNFICSIGLPIVIFGTALLIILSSSNPDDYEEGQIRLPHATRSNLRYGGYAVGTTPADSWSVRQDIIDVQCFGTPAADEPSMYGPHGMGSGFNFFLSESYRSILKGRSRHNDALSLNGVLDHGELVDRKRCRSLMLHACLCRPEIGVRV